VIRQRIPKDHAKVAPAKQDCQAKIAAQETPKIVKHALQPSTKPYRQCIRKVAENLLPRKLPPADIDQQAVIKAAKLQPTEHNDEYRAECRPQKCPTAIP
jgi:hypothetical protein